MDGTQFRQSYQTETDSSARTECLVFLPQAYEQNRRKTWPLMLFLHGSGERGNDLSLVAAHGPPRLVRERPDFPFIVVSPQCRSGHYWSNDLLLPLLDQVLEQYRIDRTRLYLTGLSMGGYGVWNLAVAAPRKFAAIAPICGGGDVLPILLAERPEQRALKTLGVWAFHGAKDPVVEPGESQRMVAAFRRIGNPARLTLYAEAGHDSWTETYDNPALYYWMLQHRRSKRPGPALRAKFRP